VTYEGPTPHAETFPESESLTYRFDGTQYSADSLTIKWYDGGRKPMVLGHVPSAAELPSQGVMMIGESGTIVCGHGKMPQLYPQEKFSVPEKVDGLDHYGVWVDGIKTGTTPNSDFAYAGPLTETVLLGVIASRVGSDTELKWDSNALKFTNSDVANRYVKEDYRRGWEVSGLS